jgi:predicted transcriptional regulator
MSKPVLNWLSRREAQIMEIIYNLGSVSAADVQAAMPDPPSYSAVRAFLRILEEKGHVEHKEEGAKYVYTPTHSWASVSKSALDQVVQNFFEGSVEKTVATLISGNKRPTDGELTRLEQMIREAREAENRKEEGTDQ